MGIQLFWMQTFVSFLGPSESENAAAAAAAASGKSSSKQVKEWKTFCLLEMLHNLSSQIVSYPTTGV
jgi:hypothetical protein